MAIINRHSETIIIQGMQGTQANKSSKKSKYNNLIPTNILKIIYRYNKVIAC